MCFEKYANTICNKTIRDGKYLARHMPVFGNVHPIKLENVDNFFRDVISLLARVVILLIDTATQEVPMKNILKKLSVQFWDTLLNCYMLNVAHVKNDVKWRPIVTKFGTLLENMSRTGLYDCHIFLIFIDNFMRISNFGMGVLHVKVKYWRIFCDVISLLALVFILSSNRVSKEEKKWNFSIAQFLWYDCTFKKQDTAPVTLTFDLWRSIYFSELNTTI